VCAFEPDLQDLFVERIYEQVELDSGFDDHGSSVFRVRTASEHVVVRSFRDELAQGPFWGCLHELFGVDPRATSEVVGLHALLSTISPIPVPRVLRVGEAADRTWLVVELMPGARLERFDELSDAALLAFGRGLAAIHRSRFSTLGNPSATLRYPAAEFPRRLAGALRRSVERYPECAAARPLLDEMSAAAAALAPPAEGALVLADLFPPQFLHEGGRLAALIDIDAYVIGPRELDFVCLEYFVDTRAAAILAAGYSELAALPPLQAVRRVYRYFLWVLTMNPRGLEIDRWMRWPAAFA
jgi:aminoglycoside phosphotransferase (APT) family kinase protein